MAITKENKEFIDSLLEHYIAEAESYRQIAENFTPAVRSVEDTAFGIIAGCVYSGFLQAYQNLQESPGLEDIREFYQILNDRAAEIRDAVMPRPAASDPDDIGKGGDTDIKEDGSGAGGGSTNDRRDGADADDTGADGGVGADDPVRQIWSDDTDAGKSAGKKAEPRA